MGLIEDSWVAESGTYQAARKHYQGLSPGVRGRFEKYGGVGKRGFIEAWGMEYHADEFGKSGGRSGASIARGAGKWGAAGAEGARKSGRASVHNYHKAPGKWRFMGLGGEGGRINMYKHARTPAGGGMSMGKAGWKALPGHSLFLGAFTGYSMYSGYQKDGLWGAAKGGVHAAAEWAAFEVVLSALGAAAAPLEGAAIGLGAGYGIYKALDYGAKRTKQTRKLEFGGAAVDDQFGTIATMRQRSLQEMQRSHGALRGALGTESQYMHIA